MDCLRRIIEINQDEFLQLGIRPGDLGSHSARKGACSFASAGSTVSPPMVSICLRAMWSMGSVKERYLQFEKAGDQYLGRVVSGLDVNDVSFAVSPPYFECDGDVKEKILILLKDFTVGGHGIQGEIFQMLYFCFASLCYHFDYLVQVLPQRSKCRHRPFYSHSQLCKRGSVTKYAHGRTVRRILSYASRHRSIDLRKNRARNPIQSGYSIRTTVRVPRKVRTFLGNSRM
jgi:hypothetical protein